MKKAEATKAKKTTNKKASTKKAGTTTRGNAYELTATGKQHLADMSGQGAIIRDCLKGSKKALTSAAIVERVGAALKAPNATKTVAFYLCTWKADGFVRFGKKTA